MIHPYKEKPENFIIEEVPLYPFSHCGDHLILKIEKRNITTLEVIRRISKTLNIREKLIGYAGLKDKFSISTQFISVPYSKENERKIYKIEDENLKILDTFLHKNKLRPGHLKGNIFTVKIETKHKDKILKRLKLLEKIGFPNFFDHQRFSKNNLELGLKLLRGERIKASSYMKRLYISAVSAGIFNEYLKERIKEGLFFKTLRGDITVTIKGEEIPTGPILGYRMPEPKEESKEFESKILKRWKIKREDFKPFKSKGTRRIIRAFPEVIETRETEDGVWIKFFLKKGSYATVLLKELTEPILEINTLEGKDI